MKFAILLTPSSVYMSKPVLCLVICWALFETILWKYLNKFKFQLENALTKVFALTLKPSTVQLFSFRMCIHYTQWLFILDSICKLSFIFFFFFFFFFGILVSRVFCLYAWILIGLFTFKYIRAEWKNSILFKLISVWTLVLSSGVCLHDQKVVQNTLRKHAYSNILKFLPPKTENFQIKILIFFIFLLKT